MARRPSAPRRKKNTSIRTPKSLDEKYYGSEPVWSDEEPTQSQVMNAYNWYNYFCDSKVATKYLFDNYPRDKKEVKLLRKLQPAAIPNILGYQARMRTRGCKIPDTNNKWFNEKIDELLVKAKDIQEEIKQEVEAKKTAEVISIQDRIREQICQYIGEIEEQVDLFTEGKYKSDFSMYSWLQKNNVKSQQSNAIAEYYKPIVAELYELQEGKDEQLKEGYSHLKKAEVKRFIAFLDNIIADAETWGANQKKVRKTRAKKPPSVEKQIARIQYQKEFKELKLVSVNPAEIIGCNQLWLFNTKYRTLQLYNAMGPSGLAVKGTTLTGFDPETSEQKKLRKPEQFIPRVLSGGKRVLSKVLSEINTKGTVPNGRINRDTIILRAIK